METAFFHMTGEDVTLEEIRENHIIPVYTRDNEPLISETAFVEGSREIIRSVFNQDIEPVIRVSHPVKGRTYEARHKKNNELLPEDQTIYYERMGFAMVIPGYEAMVGNQMTDLMVCGVKAYNLDTMNRSGSDQHFRFSIGRNVRVCLNMCLSARFGVVLDIKVKNEDELFADIRRGIDNYSAENHLASLQHLTEGSMTDRQFATVLGRLRMLDAMEKKPAELPEVLLTDGQIKSVSRAYYQDQNFGAQGKNLSMWSFYNLLTEATKTTYLDQLTDRLSNSYDLAAGLNDTILGKDEKFQWFLN